MDQPIYADARWGLSVVNLETGETVGEPATFEWRPQTAAYTPNVTVTTAAADSQIDITIEESGDGILSITGSVPLGADPVVQTYQVEDPAQWARVLFVEALARAGAAIGAAHAKTGTLVGAGVRTPFILETKALAGYLDAAGGDRFAFAVFVNDVPIDDVAAVFQANNDLGAIASQLYQLY